MDSAQSPQPLAVSTRKMTLFALTLLMSLVIGLFLWVTQVVPLLTKIPNDFRLSTNVYSIDNFYDPVRKEFTGEVPSQTRFSYKVVKVDNGVLTIENIFDVRKPSGERIFSVTRHYGVDARTGAHVPDYGDRDRDGYLFAPKFLWKQDFTYWHVNYDVPALMKFQAEEYVEGLRVYRYLAEFSADQTQNLTHLSGVGTERGVNLDVLLQLWIEPMTGAMVKYEDSAKAYFYDLSTKERLEPWNFFSNRFDDNSIHSQVRIVRIQREQLYLVLYVIPGLASTIAAGLFLRLFLLYRSRFDSFDRAALRNRRLWSVRMYVLPLLFLVLTLYLTHYLWRISSESIKRQAQSEFERRITDVRSLILGHVNNYQNALYSARGFYSASESVSRLEWMAFVDALDTETNYQGLSSFSFLVRVKADEKAAFIERVRADTSSNPLGYPGFTIYPESTNEEHVVLTYISPVTPEREQSLGIDYTVEAERARAVSQAVSTGVTSATAPIISVSTKQPSFALLLPVYARGAETSTPEQRQASYTGLIAAGFQIQPFFERLLGNYENLDEIELTIVDEQTENGPTELFRAGQRGGSGAEILLQRSVPIDVGGRVWMLNFSASPYVSIGSVEKNAPTILLVSGVSLSISIAYILYLLMSANVRAYSKVSMITRDLQQSEQKYRQIFETMTDVLYRTDMEGKITMVSPSIKNYLGLPAREVIGQDASAFYVDATQRDQMLLVLKQKGTVSDFPIQLRGAGGKVIDVSVNAHVLMDGSTPIGIEGVLRDVSERKRNEDKILEKNAELERLNRLMVDRELRMRELKNEIERLQQKP